MEKMIHRPRIKGRVYKPSQLTKSVVTAQKGKKMGGKENENIGAVFRHT